jgi:hypothetical protein
MFPAHSDITAFTTKHDSRASRPPPGSIFASKFLLDIFRSESVWQKEERGGLSLNAG